MVGVFFLPKGFTFVCPTEIAEFGKLHAEFSDRGAQILGGSTGSEFVYLAWRNHASLFEAIALIAKSPIPDTCGLII